MAESLASQADQNTQNLTEETRNWAAYGIGLSTDLMPLIRQCIDTRFGQFYDYLKREYQINTRDNSLLEDDAIRKYNFQYFERERNGAYKIRNHHQLAKCFIVNRYMVKFNQITDESFDASAAYTILSNAPWSEHKFNCFGAEGYLTLVNELRNDRNQWGHARLHQFTTQKYHRAIQRMIQLLNSWPSYVLDSASPSKLEAIKKLKKWNENSLQQGTFVKPEVLKRILNEFKVETKNNKNLAANKVEKEEYLAFKCSIWNEFKKYAENYLKLADHKVDKEEVIDLKTFIETQLAEIPMLRDNLNKIETRVEDLEDQRKKERNPKDVSNLPSRKNNFCGRGEKLEEIENLLLADTEEKNSKVIAISGLGGIGKTSIVLELANKLKDKFNGGIYWFTADGNEKITNNLLELVLLLDDRTDPNIAHKGDILVQIVINFIFKQSQNSLIIIDNLDNDDFPSLANEIINGRLLNNPKVSIIITSRVQKNALRIRIESSNCKFVNLDCLGMKEGINYMKEKLKLSEDINQSINQQVAENIVDRLVKKSKSNLNECALLEVINELGGLPLALDQFAIYVITSDNRNLQTHLKTLKDNKLKCISEENAVGVTTDVHKARLNVKTTWLMNIKPLTKENPGFQMIFDVLSFLDPTGIPTLILDPNIPGLPKEMKTLLGDDHRIIHKLTKYSLFSRADKELLTVHRMIQEVIKDIVLQEEGRLKQTLQNVDITLDFLNEQARKKAISWAITTQNGLHFANELETFRGTNFLDEEWLLSLIDKTNTQGMYCLLGPHMNTTEHNTTDSDFDLLKSTMKDLNLQIKKIGF